MSFCTGTSCLKLVPVSGYPSGGDLGGGHLPYCRLREIKKMADTRIAAHARSSLTGGDSKKDSALL